MSKVIMTVDDSSSARQLISYTLKRADYNILEATDGEDALEKLKNAKIDMLITDLNMPNMDGIQLIKGIRSMPQYRFIPIIMLTSELQTDKRQQGKSAGATGWIVKPFKPDQLVTAVKKVLR